MTAIGSESYGGYLKKVPIDKIKFDPSQNPRRYRPPKILVRQVKQMGVKEPPILYLNLDSGHYVVVNGHQRVLAAREAHITEIECEVYENKVKAQKAAIHADTRIPETKLQQYQRFYMLYQACLEEGMTEWEALCTATTAGGLKQIEAGKRRVDIFKLPPIVLSLMKEKQNRTKEEWDRLEKVDPNIRRVQRTLSIREAATIANALPDRNISEQLAVAMFCLSHRWWKSQEFIQMVANDPETHPFKIYQKMMAKPTEELHIRTRVSKHLKAKINYLCEVAHENLTDLFLEFLVRFIPDGSDSTDEILYIGFIFVNPELRNELQQYCQRREVTLNEFIADLLTEWWARERDASWRSEP